MSHGKDNPWFGSTPGIALLLALPFLLLAWLLAGAAREHAERYQQMDHVVAGFRSGLAAVVPLETLRDLAPAHILLGAPEVAALHAQALAPAQRQVAAFVAHLRAHGNPVLDGHAARIERAWQDLAMNTNDVSNGIVPFNNVENLNDEIYAALSGLFFMSDMSVGEGVGANELLLVVLDTLRKARREVGVIRGIGVYTVLRDGYFGSSDAEYVDTAWSTLSTLLEALDAQQRSILDRRSDHVAVIDRASPELHHYLLHIERDMILAPRLEGSWEATWQSGETTLMALRADTGMLVDAAEALVQEARLDRLRQDAGTAVGLLLLYGLLTLLAVMLYRTRDAAVRAQADSRAKSLFLARMSHEIRTPLNGVIGLAELLAGTQPTPRQREYIDLIGSAGRSLVTLVNDILDLAKIEAGKLTLEAVPVDIRTLAAESAQVFSVAAGRNHTLVSCHVEADVPRTLPGDPVRIRQVLLNLVSNAVKFTERGRVELLVACRTGLRGSPVLRIEVRDTGIGLKEAEQSQLFTLFTQASPEVARRYGGTGLGLSISRELVELMGGDIGVDSMPGAGATFWCELPLQPGSEAPPPAAADIVSGPALLVDGEGHLARAVRRLAGENPPGLQFASSEFDAQVMLDTQVAGTLVVINGQRSAGDAAAVAMHLHEFHPGIRLRLLLAVGDNLPDGALQDADCEVVTRSVFTDDDLRSLFAPPRTALPAQPASGPRIQPPLPRLRVLVAEDNPVNRLVTGGMLARLGVDADMAEDGRQAVNRYREAEGRYDVVLMDIDMPVLDGNDAASEIRRLERAAGWPRRRILALSAHVSDTHAAQARSAGMDGQLAKPVTLEVLRAALAPARVEAGTAG